MKIVQVNTFDIHGGAARANFRLHRGLRSLGADTAMLSKEKGADDDRVFTVRPGCDRAAWDAAHHAYRTIQDGYLNRARTPVSNTVFSYPYHPGYDLSHHPAVQEADVINLHWVAEFLSPVCINNLLALGKPVAWTLHDMWPFTGGCHYSAGCEAYREECADCPLLADDPFELPRTLLRDKLSSLPVSNLTIVSPSNWLRDRARESALFKNCRAETIPNGLDTDQFAPMDKSAAKAKLNIPESTLTLGFGTGNANEIRKGFKELLKTLYFCRANEEFNARAKGGRIQLLCFGEESPALAELGMEFISAGRIDDDRALAETYSAMDAFILPSLEDNLPNTMIEAMSCGTPVIGFRTGGVPDTVDHGHNGLLARRGDAMALGRAITDAALNPDTLRKMGENARGTILDEHTLHVQAGRYLDLYKDLAGMQRGPAKRREPLNHEDSGTVPGNIGHLPGLEAVADKILAHAEDRL